MKANQKNKMIALLQKYSKIKDELLDYTMHHHDAMHWDIEGYWESIMEDDYSQIEKLKIQVKSFQMILEGYRNIKYIYC